MRERGGGGEEREKDRESGESESISSEDETQDKSVTYSYLNISWYPPKTIWISSFPLKNSLSLYKYVIDYKSNGHYL